MGKAKPEVMKAIEKFRKSARKYGVEKIVLFGSQITGEARESSDIDLIIVSQEKDKLELLSNLYHEWHIVQGINHPVDFLCYTPKEFEKLKNQITIVRQATKTGITIEA